MPDYRGIRNTEGKLRVIRNIHNVATAPLQAEMLYPTVRNSDKVSGKTGLNVALKLYVPSRDPDYRGPVYRGTTVFTYNKMQQPM